MKNLLFLRKIIFPAVAVLFFHACRESGTSEADAYEAEKPVYSSLFDTRTLPGGRLLTIYQPTDTSKVMRRYFLYKGEKVPSDAPKDALAVPIPLQDVGCAHSTQVGFIAALGMDGRIKSVGSRSALEKNSALAGREDLGEFFNGWQFDTEKLLALAPQAVFFSPGRTDDPAILEKAARCPLILDLSPWDSHPLARTEWLKFVAEFFDCRSRADSLFLEIEQRYLSVRRQALLSSLRPKVLSSLPFNGVWYMPGGGSYKGVMYGEAALDFPWSDQKDTGSLPLDMETVLSKASDADVWFFETGLGASPTLASLEKQNKLYTHFKAYRNGAIYVCNTEDVPYFEQGIVNPDKILSDFVNIPRDKDYAPFYYQKIKAR